MRDHWAVRITHWVNALMFAALAISGVMILTAHPRFYWGETGFFDTPALFELPFKAILQDLWVRAWGRNVHFLAAWIAVLNGLAYVVWGLSKGHFRAALVPERRQLDGGYLSELIKRHIRFRNPMEASGYNVLQRVTYLGVVFVVTPLVILSGLTMSPGVTAAFPRLFTLFGGRQSARTIHFILANALVLFVLVHILMVILSSRGQENEDTV